jgi:hypothetical protein
LRGGSGRKELPPFINVEGTPLPRKNPMDANPILKELPNADEEATMHEEMVCRFRSLLAKWTKSTIWPTPHLKPIGRPKTILEN